MGRAGPGRGLASESGCEAASRGGRELLRAGGAVFLPPPMSVSADLRLAFDARVFRDPPLRGSFRRARCRGSGMPLMSIRMDRMSFRSLETRNLRRVQGPSQGCDWINRLSPPKHPVASLRSRALPIGTGHPLSRSPGPRRVARARGPRLARARASAAGAEGRPRRRGRPPGDICYIMI